MTIVGCAVLFEVTRLSLIFACDTRLEGDELADVDLKVRYEE